MRTKIKTSDIKPIKAGDFRRAPKRGTIYQPVVDKMMVMEPNTGFIVETPKGVTPAVFMNRLNMSLSRHEIPAPKGYVFKKRTMHDGNIAIVLVRA